MAELLYHTCAQSLCDPFQAQARLSEGRASAEAIRKTGVRRGSGATWEKRHHRRSLTRVVGRRGNAQEHFNSLKAVRLEYEQRVRFLKARNISLASGILSASRLRIAPAPCEGLHFTTAKVCFLVHPCRTTPLYSVSGGLRGRIAPAPCEGLHFATAKVCFLVHPCRIPPLYSVSGGLRGRERLQPAHPRATVKGALEAEPIR